MKRDKIKVLIIYVLIFMIVGLIGYLVYFVLNNSSDEKGTTETNTKEDKKNTTFGVAEGCTFDVTTSQFNTLSSGSNIQICEGLTKYVIKDVMLDGKAINVEAVYSNKEVEENDKTTGFYINDKKVVNNLAINYKIALGFFENKLFILNTGVNESNVLVYNNMGAEIYNLKKVLAGAKISDPAFTEISKTGQNVSQILTNKYIDSNSFAFNEGSFTFSSDSKTACVAPLTYKGSNYKVVYKGITFNNPEFVSYNNC